MARITLSLLVLFAFALKSFGQDLEYAKEIVKTLASPEFKGRGYVEDGNKLAANFIKDQFIQIGLLPFKKEFFQPFKVNVNVFPNKMSLSFDGVQLVAGKDFLVDASSPSIKGEFQVYPIKKEDLLNGDKVRDAIQESAGKILIIDTRTFKNDNKDEAKKADELVNFLKYSPNIPSAGTIILTNEKLTWDASIDQGPKASFIVKSDVDLKSIRKASIDVNASIIKYKTQNIIGFLEGTVRPDSFLVVLAHYDHLGKMGTDTYFPGANDNASGISMLLTLAKHFKATPPKYSMVFIALSAEELGIIGAKEFVDNPSFDLKKIKFLINFDLAGTGDDGIKVVNGSVYKKYFDQLVAINQANNYLKSVQSRGAACNSDHCMFYEKGVPCFYIYTLGGIQAYHDIYDKYETLPFTKFVEYSKLMIDFFGGIK